MKKQTDTSKLAAETAQKVLDADLGNLLKRVQSGTPLSKAQRALIEGAQAKPGIRFPVLESLAQTAAVLGVQIGLVKKAKRQGCPAFLPGNRVSTAVLIPFLFEMVLANSKSELLDPSQEKAQLDRSRRLEQERANKIADGELHKLSEVERLLWHEGLSQVRAAWVAYPRTTGLMLRTVLESAGVAPSVIQQAVDTACGGVTEPLQRLREMQPKGEANESAD